MNSSGMTMIPLDIDATTLIAVADTDIVAPAPNDRSPFLELEHAQSADARSVRPLQELEQRRRQQTTQQRWHELHQRTSAIEPLLQHDEPTLDSRASILAAMK